MSGSVIEIEPGNGGFAYLAKWAKLRALAIEIDTRWRGKGALCIRLSGAWMKFSVLLPTRERLDLLRLAVQSVLEQDYGEWEIVIADNASSADVGGYVASLRDSRVRYVRSDAVLPVTENWNSSLEHSVGEYFIMLGDDDCLMRGCLRTARAYLDDFGRPERPLYGSCSVCVPRRDAR